MQITCVQMCPALNDWESNVQSMCRFIAEAASQKTNLDLIVFPELATSGYECTQAEFAAQAEPLAEAQSIRRIGQTAKQYRVNVVYGFPEQDPVQQNILYNSAVFINRSGAAQGYYRKVHLFGGEKDLFQPGADFPVIEADFGKVGLLICWDTAFPEAARTYALKGAQLLVISSNWEAPYAADWDLAVSARAFDNVLPVAAANRVGMERTLCFFGHSKIVDPLGQQIAALNTGQTGLVTAEIDLTASERLRAQYYTLLQDRKPALYGELVKSGDEETAR